MKTSELVKVLAEGNEAPRNAWTARKAFGYWLVGSLVIVALSLWLLPVREDLVERLRQFDFYVLLALWFGTVAMSASLAIQSTFPEEKVFQRREVFILFSLLGALAAWMIFRVPTSNLAFEFYRERNYANGGCGMVITVSGVLHSLFTLAFFRQGASTQSRKTGALLALSTGAFSAFLVRFACANEHPFHVFLWHVIPLMAVVYAFSRIAPRVLRW